MNDSQKRWGLALCGIGLWLAASGCSLLIKHSYPPMIDLEDLAKPATRTEAHDLFGTPATSATCVDGSQVDWFHSHLRKPGAHKIDSGPMPWWEEDVGIFLYDLGYLGFPELFFTPMAIYRRVKSDPTPIQFALVSGQDGQIRYRYIRDLYYVHPDDRLVEATRPLTEALWTHLEHAEPPTWGGHVTAYAEETRQRATCVGHPLTPEEEWIFQRLLTLAEAVDAGRVTSEAARAEFEACPGREYSLPSCRRYRNLSEPSPVESPAQGSRLPDRIGAQP